MVLLVAILARPAGSARADHSIYFPHIVDSLDLSADLRSRVQQIMDESERQTLVVFAKFDIDPEAKPEFNKLVKARHELQAIERDERNQLKDILSKDQLKIYDRIIENTHAQVIKATRHDN
jgi:regulator of sigma D